MIDKGKRSVTLLLLCAASLLLPGCRLGVQGVKTGTVTGWVTVDDPQQRFPIPGATVTVGRASATTDAQGGFTLTGVPSGTLTATVDHDYYRPSTSAVSVMGGRTSVLEPILLAPLRVAFVSGASSDGGADNEIWSIRANGTIAECLSSNNSSEEWPVWSPDGVNIAYVSDRAAINIMDIRDYWLPHQTIHTAAPGTQITHLSWSSTGILVFTLYDPAIPEVWAIYTMPASGGAPERLPLGAGARPARNGAWSPDGRYLAYLSSSGQGPGADVAFDIYIRDMVSGEIDRLTSYEPADPEDVRFAVSGVAWSPDASRLAYTVGWPDGWGELWTITRGGGDARQLTVGESDFTPIWPKDNLIIFGSARSGALQLRSIHPDGSGMTPLFANNPLIDMRSPSVF